MTESTYQPKHLRTITMHRRTDMQPQAHQQTPISREQVDTFIERALCPLDGAEMTYTGVSKPMNPPLYVHQCPDGHRVNLDATYPRVIHLPQDSAGTDQSGDTPITNPGGPGGTCFAIGHDNDGPWLQMKDGSGWINQITGDLYAFWDDLVIAHGPMTIWRPETEPEAV